MTDQRITDNELRMLSDAVERWFEFYGIESNHEISQRLCEATVALYKAGHRKVEDIVAVLIETYVGMSSLKINAQGSASVH